MSWPWEKIFKKYLPSETKPDPQPDPRLPPMPTVPRWVAILPEPKTRTIVVPAKGGASPDYGRAKLIKEGPHDLTPCFDPDGSHLIPLADGLVWNPLKQQGHGIAWGITRSGKSVLLAGALCCYAGSSVVIDPKGELAFTTSERRRRMKTPDGKPHRVVILDPWNEVYRKYGSKVGIYEPLTRFNPLSAIDPADPDFSDHCAAIADALVVDRSNDPHWSDSARDFVAGCVAAAIEANPGHASLADVREMITASLSKLEGMIKTICEQTVRGLAAAKLGGFIGAGEAAAGAGGGFAKDFGGVRSTARTQTSVLDNTRLLAGMETDDTPFDLAELATGRVTLFLVLPIDKLETHGRWLRLILTLAIRAIARQDTPPALPVIFWLDEMGTIGKLKMVENAYGLMAGAGMRIVGFLQNISQLQEYYPDTWDTFIANSDVKITLKADDNKTTEAISTYLGKTTVEQLSEHTIARRNGTIKPHLIGPSSEYNDGLSSREREMNEELCRAMYNENVDKFPGLKGTKELLEMGYYYTAPRQMERVIVTYEPDPGYFNDKPEQSVQASGVLSTSYSTIDANGHTMRMPGEVIIPARYNPMTYYTSVEDKVWERPLLLPQEIGELSANDDAAKNPILVTLPGRRHYLLDRVVFYLDPRFKGLYRPNPLFPEPANDSEPTQAPEPEPAPAPVWRDLRTGGGS